MVLKLGDKIGITACSNALKSQSETKIKALEKRLQQMGLVPCFSPYIYADDTVYAAENPKRAQVLNTFFADQTIAAIFDISGGEVGNGVLEYLDYQMISQNPKPFFGYSDLTTVLGALFAKTEIPLCLFPLFSLARSGWKKQSEDFENSLLKGTNDLYSFSPHFLKGEEMQGPVAGGNMHCLLKLAGTPYFPSVKGHILFLEGLSTTPGAAGAMLVQLRQMGVFKEIKGMLLGQFTKIENEKMSPTIEELVLDATKAESFPIAKTSQIGHSANTRALWLKKQMYLKSGLPYLG